MIEGKRIYLKSVDLYFNLSDVVKVGKRLMYTKAGHEWKLKRDEEIELRGYLHGKNVEDERSFL